MSEQFWTHLDHLLESSQIVVDRPQGSAHPRYPDVIYPLDYGYLDNTSGGDGDGIDIWLGSLSGHETIIGAIATVDLSKRDAELKLLVNCTEAEIQIVMKFFQANQMGVYQLIR